MRGILRGNIRGFDPPTTIAVAVAIAYFVLAVVVFTTGHPNEDAYILFTYVENFAAGHGIAYYPCGPPTPGFTDLLWFFALTVWCACGLNVGVAACLVSAMCVGTTAWIMQRLAPRGWSGVLLVGLFALTFHGSVAALGGFGTAFFCTLTSAAYAAVVWRRARLQLLLIVLLPLARMEGLACAVVLAVVYGSANRSARWTALGCLVVPLLLVTWWRVSYFDTLLPLPALVKSNFAGADPGAVSALPGLVANLKFLYRETGPLPILLVIAVVAWLARHRDGVPTALLRRVGIGALPALAVLIPLLFAHQIQNVRWRFQAPVTLACVLVLLDILAVVRPRQWVWFAVLAFLPAVGFGAKHVARQVRGEPRLHAQRFVPQLGQALPAAATVATTEAGILGYWPRCRVVDVVGLNTIEYARRPASTEDLIALAPELLVFHTYGVLDDPGMPWESDGIAALTSRHLAPVDRTGHRSRLAAAAASCAGFLAGRDDYSVFAVREGRNALIYGFRRSWSGVDRVLAAFRAAARSERHAGYFPTVRARAR